MIKDLKPHPKLESQGFFELTISASNTEPGSFITQIFILFSVLKGDLPVHDDPISKKLTNCKFSKNDEDNCLLNKYLIIGILSSVV